MQCDKCGSDNTQRLQVAFEGGTQDINTRSHTTGAGISSALGLGGAGAITKTSGTTQSALAQKAAPPQKKSYKWPVLALFVGLMMLSGSMPVMACGLVLIAAGGYFSYAAFQFNKQQWPALYQHWLDSWICLKCGQIYHLSPSMN